MYIIVKTVNNDTKYFGMLSYNGTFVEDNLNKAIIFPTSALATKQKEVLAALNPNDTYTVKEIVLQNV